MPRESKKTGSAAAPERPLEQMILDQPTGKYALVSLATSWALDLRRREEYRHLTQVEILDLAVKDLLSGRVTPAQVHDAADARAAIEGAAQNGAAKEKK